MFAPAHTKGMRVLLANEPRTYREVLFEVLRWRRPKLEVHVAEPGALGVEVERLHPHLVVCSQDRRAVRNSCLAWVRLYPDGENLAEIFTTGGRATIVGMEFEDFLSVVDDTELLYRFGWEEGLTQ